MRGREGNAKVWRTQASDFPLRLYREQPTNESVEPISSLNVCSEENEPTNLSHAEWQALLKIVKKEREEEKQE